MSRNESLKVCTWNVCLGIKYKLRQVEEVMRKNKIDIICLQEVELSCEDDLSLLEINGYVMEVEKSSGKKRSMLYISNAIQYERHHEKEQENSHVILISITQNNKTVQLASIYRAFKLSSNKTHKEEFADQLKVIREFIGNERASLLIGDLNLDYNKKGLLSYNHHAMFTQLEEMQNDLNLSQLVKFNTWRRIVNGELRTSLLDHVYENVHGLVDNITEISTSISDHTPLLIDLAIKINHQVETKIMRNWSTYSKERLLNLLSEKDWNINCYNVQDFNNELEQKIMSVLEDLIPFQEIKVRKNNYSEPLWLSDMKRRRKNLFKNARRKGSTRLFERCKKMDQKIRKEEQKSNRKKIRNKIHQGGHKGLWDGVKMAQNKPQNQIPKKMEYNNQELETDERLAQGFADFFKQKVENITKGTAINPNVFNGTAKTNADSENFFTEENVSNVMKNLKEKSSYGLDNIPVRVLRDAYEILVKPYHRLLNKIYDQNVIPEQWKTSRILPLYKKGKKNQIENYRPISNLCAGSKLFERLILVRILEIEEQAGTSLTGNNQHGFKKERSTITAAVEIQSRVAALMDQDQYVAMASLDLSAAFDVVNVDLLLVRLKKIGLPTDVINLLESWLRDRQCYVEVRNCCSQYFSSDVGTVQGSILGPILFSLFISPLLEKEDLISYADDSYLVKSNKCKEIALQRLQFQIQKVVKWLTSSGLKVNVEKTEIVIFHKTDTSTSSIKMNEVKVHTKKQITVLGVIFDSKLEWSLQVENSVRKARSALQGLSVIIKYFTTTERLTLITSFFYSRLYYGSQIWLIPSLKSILRTKLFSASGAALRLLDRDRSFKELHKKYNRATPTQFQKYTTAISLYDLIKKEIPEDEWINLQFNIQNDQRNTRLSFQTNNRLKCGLNCMSNRFKSITNEIDKQWIDMTRDVFKTKCKKRLITEKLLLF
jgi:endonuclease/exonuclease/phosphatase family metal-dependent hydrolase